MRITKKVSSNNKKSNVSGIIVAAGSATRMEGIDKCFYPLLGIETVIRSAMVFEKNPLIEEIILVTRPEYVDKLYNLCQSYELKKLQAVVAGGNTRHQSVVCGVKACSENTEYIAIHDGGRPLLSQEVLHAGIEMAFVHGAATAAVPVKDTIKVSLDGQSVDHTPSRATLFSVQTPQVFLKSLWLEGASLVENPTDDGQLIEALGKKVWLSKGSYRNLKITTPEDILLAEALLKSEENI